jgi:hypothetical protein
MKIVNAAVKMARVETSARAILSALASFDSAAHLRATLPLALFALSEPDGVAALESAQICLFVMKLVGASAVDEVRLLGRAIARGIRASGLLLPRATGLVLQLVLALAPHAEQAHVNVLLAYSFVNTQRPLAAREAQKKRRDEAPTLALSKLLPEPKAASNDHNDSDLHGALASGSRAVLFESLVLSTQAARPLRSHQVPTEL